MTEIHERLAELREEREILVAEMNDFEHWMHGDAYEIRLAEIGAKIDGLCTQLAWMYSQERLFLFI